MTGGIGVRRPDISVMVCAAIMASGLALIGWGLIRIATLGHTTPGTGAAFTFGIPLALIGVFLGFNFIRGVRVIARMKRDEGVIARWTMLPGEVEAFRAAEAERDKTARNAYRVPKTLPAEGLEIVFAEDGALIGDTYFALTRIGPLSVNAVTARGGNPLSIEFQLTMFTLVKGSTSFHIAKTPYVIRAPLSKLAATESRRVFEHYNAVLAGKTLVKEDFYPARIRFGLIAAAVCAGLFAGGLVLEVLGAPLGVIPLVMSVIGGVAGIGALVLAGLSWGLMQDQRRPPERS